MWEIQKIGSVGPCCEEVSEGGERIDRIENLSALQ